MLNLKSGKHFDDAPTMTRGGFLKGILASGIAPSITLATLANAQSANASVGRGMMRNVGARNAAMFGGGDRPLPEGIELCNVVLCVDSSYFDISFDMDAFVNFSIDAQYLTYVSDGYFFGNYTTEIGGYKFYCGASHYNLAILKEGYDIQCSTRNELYKRFNLKVNRTSSEYVSTASTYTQTTAGFNPPAGLGVKTMGVMYLRGYGNKKNRRLNVYSFKINDGELFDFVPAKNTLTGTSGLFDKVAWEYHPMEGAVAS